MTSYKKFLGEFLFKKCLYLGKRNYLIHKDGGIEEAGKDYSGNVRIVILEKTYYFETLKTFPFSNIKDIRSAVEMDLPAFSPLKGGKFFIKKIEDRGDGTTVNLWFMDERITERLNALSPLFVIPESAFLSFSGRGADSIYNIHKGDQDDFFVFIDRDGSVQSMTSCGNEGDFQQFIRSIGAAAHDCTMTDIQGSKEFFSLFPAMVYDMSVKNMRPFLDPGYLSLKIDKKYAKMGIATATALFLFYLGISGIFPYLVYNRLIEEDKALSGNLSGLLKKQESIDHYYDGYKMLAERLNRYTYKLPLINLLNKVLPEETTIRQLTVSGNMVEMRGTVPKASELLGSLSQGHGVKNARFISPLKEDKKTGMEIFRLTFVYDPQITQITQIK